MDNQIRTTIKVIGPYNSPLVETRAAVQEPIQVLSRTVDQNGQIIELIASKSDLQSVDERIRIQFSYNSINVFRLEHQEDKSPCISVNRLGYPIETIEVGEDTVTISTYMSSIDEISVVTSHMEEIADSVRVLKILHQSSSSNKSQIRAVDIGKITNKQLKAIRTAAQMGYFSYPKKVSGKQIANELDIAPTTFHQHLMASQSKLIHMIFPEIK